MGNSSSRKKDEKSRKLFQEVNLNSNFVIRDVMDPCLKTFDNDDFQDMMYELQSGFPESYPEGFTEMNFHLDLTRKYPTHKTDRKMWKKLNKRSSLQFTASMVEDFNYQDESDKTYMELCRELTQPYGDREPETEETQWCLTNSLAPYATVARTNVVPFFTMQEDKNDTEMEELLTMLRELGNEPTLGVSSAAGRQDGVNDHVDDYSPVDNSTTEDETTLHHKHESDDVDMDKTVSEVEDMSVVKTNTSVEKSDHEENENGKDEEKTEGTADDDTQDEQKDEEESDVNNENESGQGQEVQENDEVDPKRSETADNTDEGTNGGDDCLVDKVDNVEQRDKDVSITEAVKVDQSRGQENVTSNSTNTSPVNKTSSLVAAAQQVKKEAEFLQIGLKSVADRVKEPDNKPEEDNVLSEEEARRRAGQKLEKRRSTLATAALTKPKTRTRSMAPNGRVAHMMSQFGEQWLLEEEESSDEEGN